jgi:hypothetical protein
MVWLGIISLGLTAETAMIVVLGRATAYRYESEPQVVRPPTARRLGFRVGAVVPRRDRRPEAGPAEHHQPPAQPDPVRTPPAPGRSPACPAEGAGLPAPDPRAPGHPHALLSVGGRTGLPFRVPGFGAAPPGERATDPGAFCRPPGEVAQVSTRTGWSAGQPQGQSRGLSRTPRSRAAPTTAARSLTPSLRWIRRIRVRAVLPVTERADAMSAVEPPCARWRTTSRSR